MLAKLSRGLEAALACASLALIARYLRMSWSADDYGSWLMPVYAAEATLLTTLVLLALLVEFRVGAPCLKLMWFCLGMLTGLVYLGMWSIGTLLFPGLVPGWAAGILATVRTRAEVVWLFGYLVAGAISQAGLMVVLFLIPNKL